MTRPSLDWQDHAACRDLDTDLFFPTGGESHRPARSICSGCPVTTPCLEYALANRIEHGIWGGTSERERRRIRQHRNLSGRRSA